MVTELSISENLHFLLMEVMGQVSNAGKYLNTFDQIYYVHVLERQSYIDNLRFTIENDCFALLLTKPDLREEAANRAWATHTITTNSKRIASFSVNIVRQVEYLLNRTLWLSFDSNSLLSIIENCLDQVLPAFDNNDIGLALNICNCEYEIDRLYLENFRRIMAELRLGKSTESYMTILFIFQYLERIGDALLNIGEAILYAILGEKIRIRQFEALQHTLAKSEMNIPLEQLSLRSFWGTRSGCNISKVADDFLGRPQSDTKEALFKRGSLRKIESERSNLLKWRKIVPELTPKVLTFYKEDEKTGALLVEFLPGNNLQEIILGKDKKLIRKVQEKLHVLLLHLWVKTRKNGAHETAYMEQILSRLESILQVHSYLRRQHTLGDLEVDSTSTLVEKCAKIERLLPAPFSVFIHGDFNANNILFDEQKNSVHFIDVHRSAMADYVQDVSVFLVSCFRLPVFDTLGREQINVVIRRFYSFTHEFAQKNEDHTFEVRLALALSRSFYTSTRFQLNTDFVKDMIMRANFLMEKVITFYEDEGDWQKFSFPEEALYL